MNKLPDKLSDLIELSITDLEKCEASPDYRIDMEVWHTYRSENCYVCLAGAVMSQTLDRDTKHDINWSSEVDSELRALDSIRRGDLQRALMYFKALTIQEAYDQFEDVIKNVDPIEYAAYEINPEQFKQYLRKVANKLREYNL